MIAAIIDWFVATLRSHPELAIFLALAIGFAVGPKKVAGFSLGNVTSVTRPAGQAVLVTYRADSAADAVTGKRVVLDVERYEFWRNGTTVTLTLSAPKGADNVDPWKKVTNSFSWAA